MAGNQRTAKRRENYPIGSVSSGTMRDEDLIPAFASELEYRLKHGPKVGRNARKRHTQLLYDIAWNNALSDSYTDIDASDDLVGRLFDALNEYAGPYFYFGAHPGDGADYGYWLSEDWDEEFACTVSTDYFGRDWSATYRPIDKIKVSDLADVPVWFRGEVAVVSDHGNVTLYVKTARTLREIWSVV